MSHLKVCETKTRLFIYELVGFCFDDFKLYFPELEKKLILVLYMRYPRFLGVDIPRLAGGGGAASSPLLFFSRYL